MSNSSTLNDVFVKIDELIAEQVAVIEAANAQIEALKTARKALQTEEPKPATTTRRRRTTKSVEDEPIKMVTEKQLMWLERKGYDGDNPEELTREEASVILDELFNGVTDEPEVEEETPRQRRAAKTRTRTKRNGNGNGKSTAKTNNGSSDDKETRKAAILRLHNDGLKPREIADELEANVSYVYLILREKREAAKK